jgi:hexosaminidase
MYKRNILIFLALLIILAQNSTFGVGADIPIIPRPVKVEPVKGSFVLSSSTQIVVLGESEALSDIARYASDRVKEQTGISLKVKQTAKPVKYKNVIVLQIIRDTAVLAPEDYRLVVSPTQIGISAPAEAGVFYGIQSLLQLCTPAGKSVKIPAMKIEDRPRFQWRGAHLDVCRHFFNKDFIKKYIDILALHKMNTFHWHLTDDQGWRIEIERYPKLTEIGAWRVDREDRNWNDRPPQMPEEKATYGGFYTQADITEIVEYAKRRYVTIVPEIEMPAHAQAALAAYPQYSCTGGPFTVPPGGVWPITDIYCAGNDSTFTFLENILDEVIELFPGKYIHIGGDEADKTEWQKCPRCQTRMKENNLRDEGELQSYFVKRIAAFLHSRGKRLIGWDEILEGGLASEATVMSWRGMNGGIAAARQGHDVVMTPGSHCYFDYYQGPREIEPLAIGGYTPLSKVYSFEPVPDSLTPEEAKHILGAQANVWTEYIPTSEHAEYMLLPRLAALSEVVWSPASLRDWKNFVPRMEHLIKLYRTYNYAKSAYLVSLTIVMDSINRQASVSLSTEMGTPVIRYTLDGTDPIKTSRRYEKPFTMNTTGIIKAAAFLADKPLGSVTEQRILIHKAFYKPVTLTYPYHKYSGGGNFALTNGIQGGNSYDDGKWQGFEFDDLDAVIDLGSVQPISRVSANFLQNTNSWIFLPKEIIYSVSDDGANYRTIGKYEIPVTDEHREASIIEISLRLTDVHARYVRVFGKNVGLCPDWHIGKGGKAWIFVDEIVAE